MRYHGPMIEIFGRDTMTPFAHPSIPQPWQISPSPTNPQPATLFYPYPFPLSHLSPLLSFPRPFISYSVFLDYIFFKKYFLLTKQKKVRKLFIFHEIFSFMQNTPLMEVVKKRLSKKH